MRWQWGCWSVGLLAVATGCATSGPQSPQFHKADSREGSYQTQVETLPESRKTKGINTIASDSSSPSSPVDDLMLVSFFENDSETEVIPPPPAPPEGGEEAATDFLSIDQAINTTLMMDPVLRAGFEAIQQATGDQITASLKPNPELEIVQTLLPLTRPFTEERQGGPPQLDVVLNYPIDWFVFGKRAAAMQAGLRGVSVSQSDYADLVRERVLETALAYYDVVEAAALLELAEQDAENLSQVEEITRVGVENGAFPQVELNRIRLDRLASQQTVRESQRDLISANAALRATMGLDTSDDLPEVPGKLGPPTDELFYDAATAVEVAQQNRPDIQALRWRVSQAHANYEVEQQEAYPEVVTQVGYTRQFQEKAIGFPDANSWGIGVSVGLPFSNRNQGNRLRAYSEWSQSSHELQAGLVDLQAEITRVIAELEAARTNAAATAEEQLELSEQVRDSIRQAYELGGRPLIDVLDSQRNYRETYRNYINSRADYWRAVYRYEAAIAQSLKRSK